MMRIRHLAQAALVSAAALMTSSAVQAQGIADWARIIIGLPTEEKDPIDYRERAPLVVPPNTNLRTPVENREANRRPNFPQDPEAVERRRAAEEARKPRMVDSITGREIPPVRRMTVDEVRAGRVAGGEVPRVPQSPGWDDRDRFNVMGGLATLREMDAQSARNPSDGSLPRAEPPRQFLTDPPAGLRTPSDRAAFRATREGQVGARPEPSPYDIFREGPNTR